MSEKWCPTSATETRTHARSRNENPVHASQALPPGRQRRRVGLPLVLRPGAPRRRRLQGAAPTRLHRDGLRGTPGVVLPDGPGHEPGADPAAQAPGALAAEDDGLLPAGTPGRPGRPLRGPRLPQRRPTRAGVAIRRRLRDDRSDRRGASGRAHAPPFPLPGRRPRR